MEARSLDNLDILIRDLRECATSIEMLLVKLNDVDASRNCDWPAILNSLRIVSTNLISISKLVRDKRDIMFKSLVLLPKLCSEDVDHHIQEITHGRISVFNQDVIPHILRTKLIPELEEAEAATYQSAKEVEQIKAFDKNISQFKKAIDDAASMIEKPKRDPDAAKVLFTPTFNYQDTWQLANLYVNAPINRAPGMAGRSNASLGSRAGLQT